MKGIIVSTCGISLLTNLENQLQRNPVVSVTKLSNKKEGELTGEEKSFLDKLIAQLESKLENWTILETKQASAELNALLTYYGDQVSAGVNYLHYFLYSDTMVAPLVKTKKRRK